MALHETVAAQRAASKVPPEILAVMAQHTEGLRAPEIQAKVARVGQSAPAFAADSHDGRHVSSGELLARGPLVVSFFRGSW